MKICILCKKPVYRPQMVWGWVEVRHVNCEQANEIPLPLPTPKADSE